MIEMIILSLLLGGLLLFIVLGNYFSSKKPKVNFERLNSSDMKHPVSLCVVDDGYKLFEGKQLEVYSALVDIVVSFVGHEGFKVGHFIWILDVVEEGITDLSLLVIPDFEA